MAKFAMLQFLSIFLSVVITTTEGNHNMDKETMENFKHLVEDEIEKLYVVNEKKSQEELETLRENYCLALSGMIEEYMKNSEWDSNTKVKLMTGLNDLSEISNPEAHTVSESLEFMVDYIKKAVETETKLDSILTKWNEDQKTQEKLLVSFKTFGQDLRVIVNNVETETNQFLAGLTSTREMLLNMAKIHQRRIKLELEFPSSMRENSSTLFKVTKNLTLNIIDLRAERETLKEIYLEQIPRHLYIIEYSLGLDVVNPEDTPVVGEKIGFDIHVLESLLQNYQLLEGLENTPLDHTKNTLLEAEIQTLEKTILVDIETFREEFRKLLSFVVGILFRTQRKMNNADFMAMKAAEMMDTFITEATVLPVLSRQYLDLVAKAIKL